MGHIISSEGLRADPNKLKAINEMPPSPDKEGVQRVLGMINYVQKFAPNLAYLAKPVRESLSRRTMSLSGTKKSRSRHQYSSCSTPKGRPYYSAMPL